MAKATGDHLFKKGQPSANPFGRPKKPRLPEEVAKILETHSPALMQLACKEALGYPDKSGEATQAPNIRVLQTLLDKVVPSLKSIDVKTSSQLPTMVLVGANTPQTVIDSIAEQSETIEQLEVMDKAPEQVDR